MVDSQDEVERGVDGWTGRAAREGRCTSYPSVCIPRTLGSVLYRLGCMRAKSDVCRSTVNGQPPKLLERQRQSYRKNVVGREPQIRVLVWNFYRKRRGDPDRSAVAYAQYTQIMHSMYRLRF